MCVTLIQTFITSCIALKLKQKVVLSLLIFKLAMQLHLYVIWFTVLQVCLMLNYIVFNPLSFCEIGRKRGVWRKLK